MESERKINWLGLFIKIIIIFLFALIIIWLISKITMKSRLSDTFKNNIANMETVATNYFKDVDLPQEKGKSLKITLGEMIEKELIVSANDKSENSCDTSKSFSKITRKKSNYVLSTTLDCGKEKSTISKKFSFDDCKNCETKTNTKTDTKDKDKSNNKGNNTDKNSNSNSNSNSSNSNSNSTNNSSTNNTSSNTTTGVTYYEYVKETKEYSNWGKGNITGDNVENRYEYYRVASDVYYSLGIIKEADFVEGNTVTYTLSLSKVPNKKYYFSKVKSNEFFNKSEESNYVNEKKVSLNTTVPKSISKYALTSNNFSYKLYPYYRQGNFYIDVEITITNTSGVSAYKNIYFVPLKLDIEFASDEITTTKPDGDYETITYYRYFVINREVIWSSENYVEGYTKTGKTEIR